MDDVLSTADAAVTLAQLKRNFRQNQPSHNAQSLSTTSPNTRQRTTTTPIIVKSCWQQELNVPSFIPDHAAVTLNLTSAKETRCSTPSMASVVVPLVSQEALEVASQKHLPTESSIKKRNIKHWTEDEHQRFLKVSVSEMTYVI